MKKALKVSLIYILVENFFHECFCVANRCMPNSYACKSVEIIFLILCSLFLSNHISVYVFTDCSG